MSYANNMSTSFRKKPLYIVLSIAFLIVSALLYACTDTRFSDMEEYVNQNSMIKVSAIEMCGDKNEQKEQEQRNLALIRVLLPNDKAHYSIDELESLRVSLNDYMMSDQSSYLNNGYHVIIYVINCYYYPTQGPIRECAVFSNTDSLYTNGYSELNDSLCTAMYKPYEEDVVMLPNISGVKYLWLIDEGYSADHEEEFPIKEINAVASKIEGLDVLYIDSRYYEEFNSADVVFKVEQGSY